MKINIIFLCFVTLMASCNKQPLQEPDPCGDLVNGVYIYPNEPPDSALTREEKTEYWNIPEDVLSCISTKGLVESCYNTPKAAYIIAGNGCQDGYNLVKVGCRGFAELENRQDSPLELINKYKSLKPLDVDIFKLFLFEVTIAQKNILKKLTTNQKDELLKLTLEYQVLKRSQKIGYLNWEGTTIIMGRLMIYDDYQPFIIAIESNDKIFNFISNGYQLSLANADTIMFYTQEYLNELKSK